MEKLHVFIDRERLGEIRIVDNERKMELAYDSVWIEKGGFPVSPHLPLNGSDPEAVRRFLSNLLPEGPLLEELSRNTHCSKSNIFGLIAAIGAETTGALSFAVDDSGGPPLTYFREVTPEELTERITSRSIYSITMWDEKPRLSVAGVQDKLPILRRSDGVMGFGEGDLASTHILKFGKGPEKHLVVNEFICMSLAFNIGLPTAGVTLERFGELVLSVRRFDREWDDGRVKRLHLIDGCQMLDLTPIYKYERPFGKGGDAAGIRTGSSLPLLFEACRKRCAVPAAALKAMLDWVLFQLIIGNSDAHGKNISFFVRPDGIFPAPAYDLVCLDLYDYDRDLAMAFGDCFNPDEIETFPLAEMAEDCGLKQRQVAKSLEHLCDMTLKVLNAVEWAWPELTPDEKDFADRLTERIRGNADRLKRIARELPKIQL